MSIIMASSVFMIFLALVIQFNHAFKPLIVFLTIPLGVVGALVALAVMGKPFGFIAFLGVASLIGVIVSHVIVLFDFIEEKHAEGAPLGRVISLMNHGAGDVLEIALAQGGETLLLPFTKRVAPRIDFDAGRIVIEPPSEVEDD